MKSHKEYLSGYSLARNIYDASHDDISGMIALAGEENCWLEFKASIYSRQTDKSPNENDDDAYWHVARSVIAFMNSSGGVIIIGIQDGTADPVPLSENDPYGILKQRGLEAYFRQGILEHLPGMKKKWSTGLTGIWNIEEEIPEGTVYIEKSLYRNCEIALVFVKPLENCLTVKHSNREYMLVRKAGAVGRVQELTTFREMNHWLQTRQIKQAAFDAYWKNYQELAQNGFHYFAFISYSHKDEKWAKWLQESLESYCLPSTVAQDIGHDKPKRIRPIFRDATDLPVGQLIKNLRHEMYYSKFLIVICSPASAHPSVSGQHYVNNEIEFFKQIGKKDKIIPVIVEGTPGGGKNECFPPALAELGILGLDVRKQSKRRTINDIVARMLDLRPDILWKRWKRRYIYNITARCIASIILCFGLAATYFYLPSKEDWMKNAEAKKIIKVSFPHSVPQIIHIYSETDDWGWSIGSGGYRPYWYALLYIEEENDKKYYLLSSPAGNPEELNTMYLGRNIEILKYKRENSFFMVKYKNAWKKIVYTGIPVADGGCAEYVGNDGIYPESDDNSPETEENGKYALGGFNTSHEKLIDDFQSKFQMHLKKNDRASLAEMLDFPQRVFLAGRREITVDKKEFIKYFDLIFYPEFKSLILSLKKEEPFCNWRGVGIGNGIIWIKPAGKGKFKISMNNDIGILEIHEDRQKYLNSKYKQK